MLGDEIERHAFEAPCPKVCVAGWLVDVGRDLGVRADELVHVPIGIHHDTYRVTRPIARRPCASRSATAPTRQKGAELAIDVIGEVKRALPGVEVVAFGAHRRSTPCPPWVTYVRQPSPRQLVDEIYNASRVFLCTSWVEGFGLANIEAMACGAALVTTDNGGSRDYALHGETALVGAYGDVAALSEHVITLLEGRRPAHRRSRLRAASTCGASTGPHRGAARGVPRALCRRAGRLQRRRPAGLTSPATSATVVGRARPETVGAVSWGRDCRSRPHQRRRRRGRRVRARAAPRWDVRDRAGADRRWRASASGWATSWPVGGDGVSGDGAYYYFAANVMVDGGGFVNPWNGIADGQRTRPLGRCSLGCRRGSAWTRLLATPGVRVLGRHGDGRPRGHGGPRHRRQPRRVDRCGHRGGVPEPLGAGRELAAETLVFPLARSRRSRSPTGTGGRLAWSRSWRWEPSVASSSWCIPHWLLAGLPRCAPRGAARADPGAAGPPAGAPRRCAGRRRSSSSCPGSSGTGAVRAAGAADDQPRSDPSSPRTARRAYEGRGSGRTTPTSFVRSRRFHRAAATRTAGPVTSPSMTSRSRRRAFATCGSTSNACPRSWRHGRGERGACSDPSSRPTLEREFGNGPLRVYQVAVFAFWALVPFAVVGGVRLRRMSVPLVPAAVVPRCGRRRRGHHLRCGPLPRAGRGADRRARRCRFDGRWARLRSRGSRAAEERVDDLLGLGVGDVGVEGEPQQPGADVLADRAGEVPGGEAAAAGRVVQRHEVERGVARRARACLPAPGCGSPRRAAARRTCGTPAPDRAGTAGSV